MTLKCSLLRSNLDLRFVHWTGFYLLYSLYKTIFKLKSQDSEGLIQKKTYKILSIILKVCIKSSGYLLDDGLKMCFNWVFSAFILGATGFSIQRNR